MSDDEIGTIHAGEHAARRWAERVRPEHRMPGMTARDELELRASSGTLLDAPPPWVQVTQRDDDGLEPVRYLQIAGDDLVVVVRPSHDGEAGAWDAITVLSPSDMQRPGLGSLRRSR